MLPIPSSPMERLERRTYWACLAFAILSTLTWLFLVLTQADGGDLFRDYNITARTLGNILFFFLIFWGGWSYACYGIKRWLLRSIGFSKEDLEAVFSNRRGSFDLKALLEKYPERKIRMIDMIGRRGRTAIVGLLWFVLMFVDIQRHPHPESLAFSIQNNYFEAILFCWIPLLAYGMNNILGRICYGAHARVMDGRLARINVLVIGTLWGLFKFVMIPLGLELGTCFPVETYGAVFAFIWISYLISDTMGEIVGSCWGRHHIRVWGYGEINRKSPAGTWAVFLSSLACCLIIVVVQGLPWHWLVLALVVSLSNTALEVFSPRGTDDFTMATANALICWAFGILMY